MTSEYQDEDDGLTQQLETLFTQADTALFKDKNFTQAKDLYNQILQLEDDNVSAINGLVYCLDNERKFDEILPLLQKAYSIDEEDYETIFNLGNYYMDHTREIDQAIDYFEKALHTAHNDNQRVKSLFNKAKCLEQKNDYDNVIQTYEELLRVNPQDHKALVNVAVAKEKLGKSEEAVRDLEKAIEAGESNRKIYTNLAIIMRKKGEFDQCAAHLDRALTLANDQNLDTSDEESDVGNGEKEEEREDTIGLKQALKMRHKDLIYYNRALLAKERGSNLETVRLLTEEAYQECLKNPKSQVRVQLGSLCEELGLTELSQNLMQIEENCASKDKQTIVENVQIGTPLNPISSIAKSNTFLQRMGTKRTQILENEDSGILRNKTFSVMRQQTKTKRISHLAQRPNSKSTIKEDLDEEGKTTSGPAKDQEIDEDQELSNVDDEGDGLQTDDDFDHQSEDKNTLRIEMEEPLNISRDEGDQKEQEETPLVQVVVSQIKEDEAKTDDQQRIKLFNEECLTSKARVIETKKSSGSLRYSTALEMYKRNEEMQQNQEEEIKELPSVDHDEFQEEEEDEGINKGWEEWSEARCAEVLEACTQNQYAMLRLAQINFRAGRYFQAKEHLERIRTINKTFKVGDSLLLLIQVTENLEQRVQQPDLYDELIAYYKKQAYLANSERKQQEAYYNKGKALEHLQQHSKALLAYEASLKYPNAHHKIYLRMAQCLKKLSDFQASAEYLEKAIELERESPEAKEDDHLIQHMLNLCVIYFHNLQDYDRATRLAQEIIQEDNANGNALLILGRIHDKLQQNEEAIKYYEEVSNLDNFALEGNFRLGKIYEKIGNAKKAISYYKQALSIRKTHYDSLIALANILVSKEEYERSLKYFKHALLFKVDDPEALYGYSYAQFKNQIQAGQQVAASYNYSSFQDGIRSSEIISRQMTGSFDVDGIIRNVNKLVQQNPEYYKGYRLLGEIYLTCKDYDRAVQNLKKSLQIKTKDSDSLMFLGRVLHETGNLETAAKYYKTALKHNGHNIKAMICLGNVTYDQSKYFEAAKYYETVIEVDKKLHEVHYDLGNAYYNMDQIENAIIHYKKATNLNPTKIEYFYNLGNALSLSQNYELAIHEYENALQLDRNNYLVYFNKGNSHFFLKQYKEAIECYLKSLEMNQDQVDCLFNLANSFQEMKDYDNAIHYYREVITKDPRSESAYMNLAHIYQVYQKKHQKAHDIYLKMQHMFPNNQKVKSELQKFRGADQ